MRLVVDTNLMLRITNPKSSEHWLFQELLSGKHTLLVTTEILEEYEEIAGQYLKSAGKVQVIMDLLSNLPSLEFVTAH